MSVCGNRSCGSHIAEVWSYYFVGMSLPKRAPLYCGNPMTCGSYLQYESNNEAASDD
jgi:hypothetical protein